MTPAPGLPALGAEVEWPDLTAAAEAEDALPPGSGRLVELARWIAGAQAAGSPVPPRHPRALVLGDGGCSDVAARTADLHGVALAPVTVPGDAESGYAAGVQLADAAADQGCDLLVVAGGEDADGAAATAVALVTGAEPVALLPRGAAAVDTTGWIRRAALLRDRLRSVTALREAPDELLNVLGSPALALAAALLMRSAARRTPMLLDGPLAAAAAVLCYDVQARAGQWWRCADDNPDPVHRHAAEDLAHRPVLDLGLNRSDGLAGLLAVGLVRAAVALRGAPR